MSALLLYLLKANGALLLFAALYYVGLRRLTFYGLNRAYLLVALLFSALYPALDITALFAPQAPLSGTLRAIVPNWSGPLAAPAAPWLGWADALVVLYWMGVAVMGGRLLVRLGSLYRLHRLSVPATVAGQAVRCLPGEVSPFSFGSAIYLNPAHYSAAELPAILHHELVHVRQWHTLDVLLAQVGQVLCWFNPGAWWLGRAVQQNLEFIADQAVLQTGQVDSKLYQYSLVQLSTLAQGPALVTPFTFHTLKSRIKMINSPKTSPIYTVRYLLIAPLVTLLLLSSCSQTGQEESVQPTQTGAQSVMANALYFVDGKKSTQEAVEQLNQTPNAIATINVLKGESASRQFGNAAAAAGVIVVTTKANQNSSAVVAFNERISPKVSMADALIIIDGKEATESELEKLPKSRIKEMNVLQGAPAETQYGVRGRNGVIVVVTGAEGTGGLNQVHGRNGTIQISK